MSKYIINFRSVYAFKITILLLISNKLFALNQTFIYSVPTESYDSFEVKLNSQFEDKFKLCDDQNSSYENQEIRFRTGSGACIEAERSKLNLAINKYPNSTTYLYQDTWKSFGGVHSQSYAPANPTNLIYYSPYNSFSSGHLYFMASLKQSFDKINDRKSNYSPWSIDKNLLFPQESQPIALLYAIPTNAASGLAPDQGERGFVSIIIYKSNGHALEFANEVSSTYFDFVQNYEGSYININSELNDFLQDKDTNVKNTILWFHTTLSSLQPYIEKDVEKSRKKHKVSQWFDFIAGMTDMFAATYSSYKSYSTDREYEDPADLGTSILGLIAAYKNISITDAIKPNNCSQFRRLGNDGLFFEATCNGIKSEINYAKCIAPDKTGKLTLEFNKLSCKERPKCLLPNKTNKSKDSLNSSPIACRENKLGQIPHFVENTAFSDFHIDHSTQHNGKNIKFTPDDRKKTANSLKVKLLDSEKEQKKNHYAKYKFESFNSPDYTNFAHGTIYFHDNDIARTCEIDLFNVTTKGDSIFTYNYRSPTPNGVLTECLNDSRYLVDINRSHHDTINVGKR